MNATLTLIAKVVPPLFALAIGVYVTWCQAVAFVGGTIPPFGWKLEGGIITGILWALLVTGSISSLSRLILRFLLAAIAKVVPLTKATPRQELSGPVLPSPLDVAGYNAGFAALCAVASQLTYASDEIAQQGAAALQAAGLSIIVERNHRCLLFVYGDCIILAFRGTDAGEVADWKTNLDTALTPGPFGLVHQGYLAAVELMWPRLIASLQRMRDHDQPLLFTGHSMGGALAVLAAAKFAADGTIPVTGLYTFGQPAVVDGAAETALADRLDGRYFRFVNSVDMVPGLFVERSLTAGGQQLFIDRAGRIHAGEALAQMASARLLTALLEPESRRAELDDHGIAEYVRVLTSAPPPAQPGSGIGGLTSRERIHLWVTAVLFAVVFVAFAVLTWTADGATAFAMGSGAVFTLGLLAVMLVWPQEYNEHLLYWYKRQRLLSTAAS